MIEKYITQTKTKPYLQAMQQRYWIKHRRTFLFPGDTRDASIQKPDFTLQAKSIHSFCQHPKYGTDSRPGKILIEERNDQNQNLESSRSKNKACDDTESSQNPRFPPLNKCGVLRVCVFIVESCTVLFDPMDYSSPGSSVRGILQARIVEWVASPFSRGSSQPRDGTLVSCIAGRFFTA